MAANEVAFYDERNTLSEHQNIEFLDKLADANTLAASLILELFIWLNIGVIFWSNKTSIKTV